MLNFSGLQVTLVRVFILLVRCASIPHFHLHDRSNTRDGSTLRRRLGSWGQTPNSAVQEFGVRPQNRYGRCSKECFKGSEKHHGESDWKGLAGMRDKLEK